MQLLVEFDFLMRTLSDYIEDDKADSFRTVLDQLDRAAIRTLEGGRVSMSLCLSLSFSVCLSACLSLFLCLSVFLFLFLSLSSSSLSLYVYMWYACSSASLGLFVPLLTTSPFSLSASQMPTRWR